MFTQDGDAAVDAAVERVRAAVALDGTGRIDAIELLKAGLRGVAFEGHVELDDTAVRDEIFSAVNELFGNVGWSELSDDECEFLFFAP
jgi:hypothetical protein